jgi:baseplate hub protein gp41
MELQQFGRSCKLIVYGADQQGLDLSELHIVFNVKRSDTMTPNIADIRVYNLDDKTAQAIKAAFAPGQPNSSTLLAYYPGHVLLQGGYESNFGVIFQGNIKQIIIGRESATETFMDIIAGDGERAYNYAVVSTTIAAGSTQKDQIATAVGTMNTRGVSAGDLGKTPDVKLPRGKVMHGNARKYLRDAAANTDHSWSIQDEKVTFIPKRSYLPGEAVILTSKTGMVGAPQQTDAGVNVKCLMNPLIQIGTRIKIDNASIQRLKINLSVAGSSANIPAPLSADGVYYVLSTEHQGDNRGINWYTTVVGIMMDISTNPINSVQTNYGF